MNDSTSANGEEFEVGDHVELVSYHRMRGRYGGWSARYLAPGLRGKVVGSDTDPDRGQVLYVRHEQGPAATLYADEVRRVSYEEVYEGHSDELPTLQQRIGFLRSILAERRRRARRAARRPESKYAAQAQALAISEEEAASKVGASDLSELTPGENGTAQELIDRLLAEESFG